MSIWFEVLTTIFMIVISLLLLINYNASKNNFEGLIKIHEVGGKIYQLLLGDAFIKAGKTFIETFKKRFYTYKEEDEK